MSPLHKPRQSLKFPSSVIFEFEKYVLQHADFAASIPRNAVVFMQVEKDREFNRWSQSLMEKQHKNDQPVFCVRIKKMRPIQSRIEKLRAERSLWRDC